MEDWERDGHEMFESLRLSPSDSDDVEQLIDRSVDRAKDSIGASDFVEFATGVFVGEFLGPVLDVVAYALGLEDEGSPSTDDTEPTNE